MSQPLEALVHFEKSIYKLAKSKLKSLKKDAKKARKKDDRELELEDAHTELEETLDLLAQHADTSAGRELAEASARADVVVDGQTIIEDVPARTLVTVGKQLRRLEKTTQELMRLYPEGGFDDLASRVHSLNLAIQMALQEANQTAAPERQIGEAIVEYLTAGPA